jgi:hypothetical protein
MKNEGRPLAPLIGTRKDAALRPCVTLCLGPPSLVRVVVGATVGLSNYEGEIVLPATLHALGLTNLDKFPQAPKVKKLVRCRV